MTLLRTLLVILILVATVAAAVLFTVQNPEPIALDTLVYKFQPRSLALWVLSAFALGGVAGMLASSMVILRLRASRASSNRQLRKANTELDRLRTAGSAGGE